MDMQIIIQIDSGDFEVGKLAFGPIVPPASLSDCLAAKNHGYWESVLRIRFGQWKEEIGDPDTDEEFLTWLVQKEGWKIPDITTFTIEVE